MQSHHEKVAITESQVQPTALNTTLKLREICTNLHEEAPHTLPRTLAALERWQTPNLLRV